MEIVNQIEYNGALYNIKDVEAQKSLVYSQNETDTGMIWFDGKKIYRKVIILPAVAKGTKYSLDISNLMISTSIQINGFIKISADTIIPLLNSDEVDHAFNTYIKIQNNMLIFSNGAKREILDGFAILEYTKTTN